jgi:beta-glucosidase
MAVGLFEKNFGQAKKYTDFGSENFKNSAENTALESITLLKNDNGILPLSKNAKILVSGPAANSLNSPNGAWTHTWQGVDSNYNSKDAKTILEALKLAVGDSNISFSKGAEMYYENGWEQCRLTEIEDFKEKAKNSDIILLCLGELPSTEKPGDIRSLDLPAEQIELAKIAYATGKKVVIVLTEARPRILHSIVEGASGIIQTYLPGDYGANALAKILFGDVNPSGKLPYTYPKYNGVIEFYDHPKSVDRSKANDFNAFDPEWEFGYGLSYTQFAYSNLVLSSSEMKSEDILVVRVTITNTGEIAGKEVVQLFLSDNVASMVPAGKRLKGFEKIALLPNETKTVQFKLTKKDLEFSDANGKWITEPGSFDVRVNQLKTSFDFK